MTTTETAPLRIIELRAENLKRLKAVEITPVGDIIEITGKNGQGKTSVLDAIWFALGGGQAAKDTTRPIRDGETSASVTVDLGELVVTRTWTSSGTKLVVENAAGAVFRSPQAVLDELVGRLSFDPLAFSQLRDAEQLKTLLSLVELPFDPAAVDAERKAVFDERTDINRDAKRVTAQLAGMPEPEPGLPDEEVTSPEVNISALVEAHQAAQRQHAAHTIQVGAHKQATDRVEQLRKDLAAAERILTETPDPDDEALPELDAYQREIEEAQEANREARNDADATNRKIRQANEYRRVAALIEETRAAAAELTVRLDATDKRKAEALAAAKMPIDGLSFDDDGVTYHGIPFRQCSAAERLRVSLAMAMALNPRLRVIRITDGSLLDSDNRRLIEEMAGEHGFQVWIERVDESGSVGIVIEDGAVKATT